MSEGAVSDFELWWISWVASCTKGTVCYLIVF